jgi:hypothetical protein
MELRETAWNCFHACCMELHETAWNCFHAAWNCMKQHGIFHAAWIKKESMKRHSIKKHEKSMNDNSNINILNNNNNVNVSYCRFCRLVA